MFQLVLRDIEQIDRTSIRILSELGVRVDDAALREQAVRAGARPGRDADRIRMSEEMVRQLVALAPHEARYADLAGNVTTVGLGARPTFWTGAALNYVTGRQSRAITAADLAEFCRVADTIDPLLAVVGTSIEDVPPECRDFVGFRIMAENTSKHLRPLLFTAQGVAPILEMAQVLADGKPLKDRPLVSFGYSCLCPLHWSQISIDLWRATAGHNIPVMLNGEPIAGASSPVTLAGALALANAEILAGVVLTQLLEPGRPVIHNLGFAHVTDMRSGTCLSGTAECGMLAWAGARLAAFYRLPSASWMCTDSFIDDEQAAQEKMLTAFAHVSGGVNIIWGMGQLESEKTLSPVQLVMDEEVARAALRWWDGFKVDDDALAYDVIRDHVEKGEDFLGHEHTFTHFRSELSLSPLMARSSRGTWEQKGATSLAERAAAKVRDIVASDPPQHLSDQQRKDLRAIEQRELKRRA
ncbi:MAG: trimethylamine methyltransferase family protein [Planctomycetes bacterium]|nr:trimethylamine methyltransferase family protein [Planctomycetota bacterium]